MKKCWLVQIMALVMVLLVLSSCKSANTLSADIVVIGGGGAGMTAALQASQKGAKNVVILEKMPQTGGNTIYATAGLNAAGTPYQKAKGIEDTIDQMIEDTIIGGKGLNNTELVKTLAQNSADAVKWIEELGGDLSDVGRAGGATVDRVHRPTGGAAIGPMLVKVLNENLKKQNIPIMLDTTATQVLLNSKGQVSSVKAKNSSGEFEIKCKAVILATGGFGANAEMVVEYNPILQGFKTTNQPGATGDGIVIAKNMGAALVDMKEIQTHPTVEPETATMYTEAVRGNGAILVNKEGKRFINELETRDVVSQAILEQTNKQSYLVFDQGVRDSLSAIEKYINKGIIVQADTIEQLAAILGIDGAALNATINNYNEYAIAGTDVEYGRTDMRTALNQGPYYAGLCAPAIHHTMGGVKIDTSAEVMNTSNNIIPGMFAAGEVTGGVHGANRLAGTAMTDIVVFGRIAGDSAAQYVEKNGGFTKPSIVIKQEQSTAVTPNSGGNYRDGVYTGIGKGNNGDLTVEVTVKDGSMISIVLKEHSETPGIYESAEKHVIEQIVKTQTLDVDVVSGATYTSNGIKEAVKDALSKQQ